MAIAFTADDILAMAVRIEQNAARFYQAAAQLFPGTESEALLIELADWEHRHEQLFSEMRANLTAAEREIITYDPAGEAALYLQTMADSHVFDIDVLPTATFGDSPTLIEIITVALDREKDSLAFYSGMKQIVPPRMGQQQIDAVITEELGHIRRLMRERERLRTRQ